MHELRHRGVEDFLIAVADGLKGFPEASTGVFPETRVPTCLVPLTRFSLTYDVWLVAGSKESGEIGRAHV